MIPAPLGDQLVLDERQQIGTGETVRLGERGDTEAVTLRFQAVLAMTQADVWHAAQRRDQLLLYLIPDGVFQAVGHALRRLHQQTGRAGR